MPSTTTSRQENKWSPEEDQILRQAVAEYGRKNCWRKVSACLPGRNNKSCRKRWIHSLAPELQKGRWSAAEDAMLLNAVKEHGQHWWKVARDVRGRTDDQCAKRWREKLDPSITKTPWSPAEDQTLLDAFEIHGKKWNAISALLVGRPAVHCRNRYQSLQRSRAASSTSATRHQPVVPDSPRAVSAACEPDRAVPSPNVSASSNTSEPPRTYWLEGTRVGAGAVESDSSGSEAGSPSEVSLSPATPAHRSPLSTGLSPHLWFDPKLLHGSFSADRSFGSTSSTPFSSLSDPNLSPDICMTPDMASNSLSCQAEQPQQYWIDPALLRTGPTSEDFSGLWPLSDMEAFYENTFLPPSGIQSTACSVPPSPSPCHTPGEAQASSPPSAWPPLMDDSSSSRSSHATPNTEYHLLDELGSLPFFPAAQTNGEGRPDLVNKHTPLPASQQYPSPGSLQTPDDHISGPVPSSPSSGTGTANIGGSYRLTCPVLNCPYQSEELIALWRHITIGHVAHIDNAGLAAAQQGGMDMLALS